MLRIGTVISTLVAAMLGALALAPAAQAAGKSLHGVTATAYPSDAAMQRLAAAGVEKLRIQFFWGAVEPQPGVRDWTLLDRLMENAARAGVDVLPALVGSPAWISADSTRPPLYSPQERAGWAAFVSDLAARYGPAGVFWAAHPEFVPRPLRYYQVWNEVNLPFFWGGRPNARRYASLVRLTRGALHSVDRGARIVLAGLLPYKGSAPGQISSRRYLKRLYRANGMRAAIDVVAIHPYGPKPSDVVDLLAESRRILRELGVKAPIWATEFGWSTGGVGWAASPFGVSASKQARNLRRTYRLLRASRKRLGVRRAFWYNLQDDPAVQEWNGRMGLLDVSGAPKPAWFAYARSAGGTP